MKKHSLLFGHPLLAGFGALFLARRVARLRRSIQILVVEQERSDPDRRN